MSKDTTTTESVTAISETSAHVSFAAAAAFVVLLAALHFLEPEFDPSWRFISEYELGRYGWAMRLAFFFFSNELYRFGDSNPLTTSVSCWSHRARPASD